MNGKQVRVFRTALFGAYLAIPVTLALGTYEGWLFLSSTPSALNTNIAVGVVIVFVLATRLAEYAVVFERAATGRIAYLAMQTVRLMLFLQARVLAIIPVR